MIQTASFYSVGARTAGVVAALPVVALETATWRPRARPSQREARVDAEGAAAPAVDALAELEADWSARLDAQREELESRLDAAHAAGVAEGEARLAARCAELESRLAAIAVSGIAGLTSLRQASRDEAVALGVLVARAVVATEVRTRPEVLRAVLDRALHAVPEASRVDRLTVRCHPDDAQALTGDDKIHVEASPAFERGGLVIELPDGTVDATLSTAFDEVLAAMRDGLLMSQSEARS